MIGLRTTLVTACVACAMALSMAQAPLCVDPSFQAPFTQIAINNVAFLSSDQILVGGVMRYPGMFSHRCLYRLNSDGSLDTGYLNPNNYVTGGGIKLWDEEYFFLTLGQGVLRCFIMDGSVDMSYGSIETEFSTGQLTHFYIFPDEKQWRTGWYSKRLFNEGGNQIGSEPGYGLIQVLPDGSPDPDFDHKYTAPGWLTSISETPDGRFLLGSSGGPTQYEGQPVGGILRVWPDGQLDTSFHSSIFWGAASPNYYFYPDGRILAFGNFQAPEYPGDTLAVMRLHPDGSTDTTWPVIPFRGMGFFPGLATTRDFLEIEPGKLIVVGEFNAIGEQPAGAIAVIDTAGNVLWDLFTGADAGELVIPDGNNVQRALYGIEQAPDGFIYIFGSYAGFDDGCSNHTNQRLITRLHPMNVGVDDQSERESMVGVYPNPGHERIWFDGLEGEWPVHASVFDARSVLVLQGTVQPRTGMDMSALTPGFYTIAVHVNSNIVLHMKWIKE